MQSSFTKIPGRRNFLKTTGHLLIGFNLFPLMNCQTKASDEFLDSCTGIPLRPHTDEKLIDSWIRIDSEGQLTILTGKQELGQGIRIALIQIAADELDIHPNTCKIINADTGQTPNEGYTAGSNSVEGSGTAIRRAASEARLYLLKLAAAKWNTDHKLLTVTEGTINAPGGKIISYAELLEGKYIEEKISGEASPKSPNDHRYVGKPFPREDIQKLVRGEAHFIHDLRLPGMVHARILHPPSYNCILTSIDLTEVESSPGILKVIKNGSLLAVIASREYQAIKARENLKSLAVWEKMKIETLPNQLLASMKTTSSEPETVESSPEIEDKLTTSAVKHQAEYFRPYQMHASMGPSCAIALWEGDQLTVWSPTQGVYPLQNTLADLFSIASENIRCIGVPGSGCYGHNGADDVSAEAALIAKGFPGKPVRLQWMREDENMWEPYGSAMAIQLEAGVDTKGKIIAWDSHIWSDTHSTRPNGRAGNFISARHLEKPFEFQGGGFSGGSYRNGIPLYTIPAKQIQLHNYSGPLRTSAMRGLGAYANIFALESFIDELAHKGKFDPMDFRIQNLDDERGVAVLERLKNNEWKNRAKTSDNGFGLAFSQYKNSASYFAVLAEVQLDRDLKKYLVKKLTGVIDSGQTINPDGLRNQTEGGMIQSTSWSTLEEVAFDENGILSSDWTSYAVIRATEVPEVEVHIINRPELPSLGAGEAAQGPVAAAIANAIFDATGSRIRELPLKPEKINWDSI